MITQLFKKVFGTRNERLVRRYGREILKINAAAEGFAQLTDAALREKTAQFKQRLQQNETVAQLLPEAFAVVREASARVLKMRHFDVQLIGGMVMHEGKIAEMRTGEGKTLMATLAAYLNALSGQGVHIITVNDYLAKRDAAWMAPLYEFLGLTVGVNVAGLSHEEKQKAYNADITYGTNNEFGFDYLRDNMVFEMQQRVQRELHFAIVDEVDSILIDEARTPLIISGAVEESSALYEQINELIPRLTRCKTLPKVDDAVEPEGDFFVDEKERQVQLTEAGHQQVETLLMQAGLMSESDTSLYSPANILLMHYLMACLRAHSLYHRDVEYIVKNNQVIIVDEHTGRLMEGRRWSDGLHQAVEAKEKVAVQLENQTLATITFQNYFRLYKKLAGMTGTADTEAFEFQKIYGLEVVVIPTNRPAQRQDDADLVYLTKAEKFKAIIADIQQCLAKQQPVLVGTASIEMSEIISNALKKEKIPHQILNAKQHEREAKIIAEAGRPGAVTIATNMAGRGTDIVLGGNLNAELAELDNPTSEQIAQLREDWQQRHDTVIAAGGLHVLGTERHESRRIDNQLRGRSGRQGDPGSSRFYLSLEDNLLRIFAADRMQSLMRRLGVQEGEVISHPWVTRAIENAQRRVEGMNFDIRKQLLEFDDVANDQRKVIYRQRTDLMQSQNIAESIQVIFEDAVGSMIHNYIPAQSFEEQWNIEGLQAQLKQDFALHVDIKSWLSQEDSLSEEQIHERVLKAILDAYQDKEKQVGSELLHLVEKNTMLQLLDQHWKDHLAAMDHLRRGIHLRGYAQKNPTQEYKRESFNMFQSLLDSLKYEVVSALSLFQPRSREGFNAPPTMRFSTPQLHYEHQQPMGVLDPNKEALLNAEEGERVESGTLVLEGPRLGRNDPCHCGSGKKYKQCHGRLN